MSMTLDIAPEGASAVDSIMPVMQSAFDPAFGEAWTAAQCFGMLTIPGTDLLVARHDSAIVGFALMRSILDETELLLIAIHQQHQKKGYGRQLAVAVIDQASQRGSKFVFLEVREGNPALNLYLGVGFVQVGKRESYYRGQAGEYFNALTLRYEIAP